MRKKKHPIRNFLMFLVFCALIYSSYYIFEKSDFFIISDMHVIGNYKAEKSQMLQTLGEGPHLIKLSKEEIETRISKHPWIKSVDVKKVFPNMLEVLVIERMPVMAIKYSDHFLLVDDQLVVLDSSKTSKGYDVVHGLNFESFDLGVAIFHKNQYILRNTIDLVYFLSFHDLDEKTEIIIDDKEIILRFNDHLIARFGDGENMESRFYKMIEVYRTIEADGNAVGTIIVNHDGEPTLNPFDY
jgi:cell division protein FtsQ